MLFKTVSKLLPKLFEVESQLIQQIRTTFVVKRRWPPGLHKVDGKPRTLRGRHYVYDLVKDTNIEKRPDINLILTTYVDGYGNVGDQVTVKHTVAYSKLLLPGLAVYATSENVAKFCEEKSKLKRVQADAVHSSPFAQRTVNVMSQMILAIIMNKDVEWTLEKWHVRASFRKAGYHVSEEAITLPQKPIRGPNLDLQRKDFYVSVTVNEMESFNVRCRIHHWSTNIVERLPYQFEHWKEKCEPMFPEDADILSSIPYKHKTTT